ncbi:uncharacterized protein LOC108920623 [Arapaima gigas]
MAILYYNTCNINFLNKTGGEFFANKIRDIIPPSQEPFPALVSTMTHKEKARQREFQVNQSGWTAMNPNRPFTIGCECSTTDTVNEWELEMKLQKESDSDWFCIATENGNSKGNCFGKKKAWNKAEFTLTDQAGDHVDNYTCTFTRTHPLPIILKQGKGTIVFPSEYFSA